MGKSPLIFLLLTICLKSSIAQNFSRAIHTEYNVAETNIILHQNNLYFSCRTIPSTGQEKAEIYSFTNNGTFRFKQTISLGANTSAIKIFASNDDKIIITGYVVPDCHVAGALYPFLAKLDTNGQVMFTNTYTNSVLNGQKIQDACQLNNNNYYLIGDTKLFRVDPVGNYVSATNMLDSVFAISPHNNGNDILLNAIGDANFFSPGVLNYFLSSSLSYLNDKPSANRYKKIHRHKGRYIAIHRQGYIEALDSSFIPLANTLTSQNFNIGSRVADLSIVSDTLYAVIQHTNNSGSGILRLDTNLNVINNYNNLSAFHKTQNIVVSNQKIYLNINHLVPFSSFNNSGYKEIPYMSLVSVPASTIYSYEHDISLTNVSIDQSFPINTYTNTNGSKMVDLKFKATIKNVGASVINSFYLTANRGSFAGDACYRNFIHKHYTSQIILPGDSVTVATDVVAGLLQQQYFPNSVTIENICFTATAPNEENDNSLLNNINCPNLSLSVTDLQKLHLNSVVPSIYPNPASSILYLENISGEPEIYLLNCLGEICKKYENLYKLDISDVDHGIYFLHVIWPDKKSACLKVVIQR